MAARTMEAHAGLLGQHLIVSDLAAAEFSAGVARRHRVGDITGPEAAQVFAAFDAWLALLGPQPAIETIDFVAATALIRRLDLGLRMPDATNIAMAQRLGANLFTFDKKMAAAARAIGLPVAP
jgi:predicted nucleic acid-binding protein